MTQRTVILLLLCLVPTVAQAQADTPASQELRDSLAPASAGTESSTDAVEQIDVVEARPLRYGNDFAQADRIFNILTARTARKGNYIITINHRAYEAVSKDPWFDYAGLDGGSLKIGLGVRYGLLDGLDAGVFRLNGTVEAFDTYELDARYQILNQNRFGCDLAVRGGVSWFSQKNAKDASGFVGQLLLDRIFADRIIVGGGLLYHSSSSNDKKRSSDTGFSVAGTLFTEYRFLGNLAADAEVAETLGGYHSKYPNFTVGLKAYTNRHTFALLVTNTQYMGADGMLANTWRAKPTEWIIGFNITREI